MAEPSLSIVIAAWPNLAGLADCLEALSRQRDASTECIVVSPLSAPLDLIRRFPWVSWSQAAADCLIPHLWGLGMAIARGGIIAITTAHFTPSPDWVQSIRQAHARWPGRAVGGRIEPPRGGGAVSWAIYFLRYSAYLGYQQEQIVPDVAGDNASYERSTLNAVSDLHRQGFWELELHQRLCADGRAPVFVPAICVAQCHAFGFWSFLGQRFRHGRQFGSSRAKTWGVVLRLAAGFGSPGIPALFFSKIVLRVLRSRRHIGPFLGALPALLCFLLAWAAGEACGYFAGVKRANAQPRDAESDSSLSALNSPDPAEVSSCP